MNAGSKYMFFCILILGVLMSCNESQTKKGETDTDKVMDRVSAPDTPQKPNTFPTEHTDVNEEPLMDEMDFMPPIENDRYYGFEIGQDLGGFGNQLVPGELKTGEGGFKVHYMLFQSDTLGYVYGAEKIESIHIWDPRGATHEGVRVGTTFAEAKQLLRGIKVHGSEVESRTYVVKGTHRYRLNYYSTEYDININEIPDTTKIQEIIIVP